MATTEDFKPGDQWDTGASVYEILEVHRDIRPGNAWTSYSYRELTDGGADVSYTEGGPKIDVLKVKAIPEGSVFFQPVAFAKTWTKVEPKWEVGKVYRRADDDNDLPEYVEKVFSNGSALIWYDNIAGDRYATIRAAAARVRYQEVEV